MSSIKWDEETIAEHDKLRGTRQKINEPDTPFEHKVKGDSDDEDVILCTEVRHHPPNHEKDEMSNNWEALNAKLTYESMQQRKKERVKDHEVSIGEYTGGDDDNDMHSTDEATKKRGAPTGCGTSPEDSKKSNFASKRAAHYNEFLVLKALKQKQMEEEEDEEEGDDA